MFMLLREKVENELIDSTTVSAMHVLCIPGAVSYIEMLA